MKKTFFISFFAVIASLVSAQSDIGLDYFALGEYDAAKRYFEKQINQSPAQANYYLGEIAFIQGKPDEAKAYYQKGLAADPNDLYNQIGEAKLLLKSDLKSAENLFKAIQNKSKKDPLVILAIGRAYFDSGILDKAQAKADEARKRNKAVPQIYIFEGDLIEARNGGDKQKILGDVAGKYEMAIHFDGNYRIGYIKAAQAYALFNPQTAIEKLKDIIELQPDYLLAHRQLGQVSTQIGHYNQAIQSYKRYMAAGEYSLDDLKYYVRVLYFSDLYEDAQKTVNEGLALAPNDFVLNRLQMYIYAKTKNTEKGLPLAEKFFNLREDKSTYLALDYSLYAIILKEAKLYDQALAAYDKAIEMEAKIEYYTDAVEVGRAKGDYGISAKYYTEFMNTLGDAVEARELNTLGFYYYNAGTLTVKRADLIEEYQKNPAWINTLAEKGLEKDSLQNSAGYFARALSVYYLNKADSVFKILVEKVPDSYSGYRWLALTQHAINSDAKDGAAKPHYEKVIEVITGRDEHTEASNKVLIEAYGYLAYHYYLVDNVQSATAYCNEILKLDPENKTAIAILDGVKQHEEQLKEYRKQQAAAANK
ncbi:MAG: tetratricopeptide repeat protein [Prevotellaceae bacterium]|jgi:tetratricopeptide (TPR) repeat protein|nr:tetratricopeptide repeat protein [Prevotellaceae bacterium]